MEKKKIPFVSVVITTKDRFSFLEIALKHLACQTYPAKSIEVFVIDAGTDKTQKKIQKLSAELPYTLKYSYRKGLSISASRNLAIKQASGEYIIILDDDVFPVPTYVEAHVKTHLLYPKSIVQGELLPAPGTALLDRIRLVDITKARRDDSSGMNHCNVHTFNLSVPREDFLAELFTEEIDQYGWEDVECGYRLTTLRNLKLRYSKEALAYHYKPEQDYQGVASENFAGSKGMLYFLIHHPDVVSHENFCLLKRHGEWLVKSIRQFTPMTLSEFKQKISALKVCQTKAQVLGAAKIWEELQGFYHDIELYAAKEGAWCKLYDLPVKQSIFTTPDHEIHHALIKWPVKLRSEKSSSFWEEELSAPFLQALKPFCSSESESPVEIRIFPSEKNLMFESLYPVGLCAVSLLKDSPASLAGFREIWVPSEFDKTIFENSNLSKAPISIFPYAFPIENCSKALLHPEFHSPEIFSFFSDVGHTPDSRNLEIQITSFLKTFQGENHVALILGFPEQKKAVMHNLLRQWDNKIGKPGTPLIAAVMYSSPWERQKFIASSDCVLYTGIGESFVPYLFEAAAMGKGILTTDFGGHMDFLNSTSAFLIRARIKKNGWKLEAESEEESVSSALKKVFSHPEECRKKGMKAKTDLLKIRRQEQMLKDAFLKIQRIISNFSEEERAAFLPR